MGVNARPDIVSAVTHILFHIEACLEAECTKVGVDGTGAMSPFYVGFEDLRGDMASTVQAKHSAWCVDNDVEAMTKRITAYTTTIWNGMGTDPSWRGVLDTLFERLHEVLFTPDALQWGLTSDDASTALSSLIGGSEVSNEFEEVCMRSLLSLSTMVYEPYSGGGGGSALNDVLMTACRSTVNEVAPVVHHFTSEFVVMRDLARFWLERFESGEGGGGRILRATHTAEADGERWGGDGDGGDGDGGDGNGSSTTRHSLSHASSLFSGALFDPSACPAYLLTSGSVLVVRQAEQEGWWTPQINLHASLSGLGEVYHPRSKVFGDAGDVLYGVHGVHSIGKLADIVPEWVMQAPPAKTTPTIFHGVPPSAETQCAPNVPLLSDGETALLQRTRAHLRKIFEHVNDNDIALTVDILSLATVLPIPTEDVETLCKMRCMHPAVKPPPITEWVTHFVRSGGVHTTVPCTLQQKVLSVATYNVNGAVSPTISHLLMQADVTVLTEVHHGTLDWVSSIGCTVFYSKSQGFGPTIIINSRSLEGFGEISVERSDGEDLAVTLRAGAVVLCTIVAVHLDYKTEAVRVEQLGKVFAGLKESEVQFVVGDFNALVAADCTEARLAEVTAHRARTDWEPPCFDVERAMKAARFCLAGALDPTPTCWAGTRIDHVWWKGGVTEVVECGYRVLARPGGCGEAGGGRVEDHVAVWSAFSLK